MPIKTFWAKRTINEVMKNYDNFSCNKMMIFIAGRDFFIIINILWAIIIIINRVKLAYSWFRCIGIRDATMENRGFSSLDSGAVRFRSNALRFFFFNFLLFQGSRHPAKSGPIDELACQPVGAHVACIRQVIAHTNERACKRSFPNGSETR